MEAWDFNYDESEDVLYLDSEYDKDYWSASETNTHDFWSLDDYIFSDPYFYGLSKDRSDYFSNSNVQKICKINYLENEYEWS